MQGPGEGHASKSEPRKGVGVGREGALERVRAGDAAPWTMWQRAGGLALRGRRRACRVARRPSSPLPRASCGSPAQPPAASGRGPASGRERGRTGCRRGRRGPSRSCPPLQARPRRATARSPHAKRSRETTASPCARRRSLPRPLPPPRAAAAYCRTRRTAGSSRARSRAWTPASSEECRGWACRRGWPATRCPLKRRRRRQPRRASRGCCSLARSRARAPPPSAGLARPPSLSARARCACSAA
mmetsp:Transcript_12027/g.30274  ORF Transcript_12027/g.30274 Transcript_12027/m.30274 type:complete len:244 (-) Transcript_12027:793-1524(-)